MKKSLLFWVPVGAAAVWAGAHFLPGFGHFSGFDFLQGGQGHDVAQGVMQGKAQGAMQGQDAMMQGGHGMKGSGQGQNAAQGMMQGGRGGHGGGHGMMGGHGGKGGFGFGFGWTTAVVGAGLALFGAAVRKRAGETTWKKWAGYGLIAAGLATVFKPILPIVALGAGAYWLLKKKGSSQTEEVVSVPYTEPIVNSNATTLDTWEQSISKEDK